MIYLFYGSDVEKVRSKAFEWVAKARAKEPNLAYVRLAREELSASVLEDATLSGGLFIQRLLVLIDDPYPTLRVANDEEEGDEVGVSALDEYIDALAVSDNAIVLVAPKLGAIKVKKLAPKAKVEYKYDKPVSRMLERGFNSSLVNALGSRSPDKLWLEVQRALRAGDAPEMLHGLLHWKARDLLEKGSRAWGPRESRELSLQLIELLQSSRRGGLGLDIALEKFSLSI
ncbi:MAG: hypothetical protein JWN18_712 [Parcubacteria group bacterium]|nr:hypothetical protein [Parcubacteria group bacterium]